MTRSAASLPVATTLVVVAVPSDGGSLLTAQSFAALWCLALPLLVAYALLRHRIFGIELKARWTIERGTFAAAFLAIFFVVAEVAQNFFSDLFGWLAGGIAAGLALFALAPLQRLAERLGEAALPKVSGTPEYLAHRKIAIYHAAVEGAWSDRAISQAERRMLDRLRTDLGIAEADAAAVERDVEARITSA